jgi:hypothetical protein
MQLTVTKRAGEIVNFDSERIFNAIMGANAETNEMTEDQVKDARQESWIDRQLVFPI